MISRKKTTHLWYAQECANPLIVGSCRRCLCSRLPYCPTAYEVNLVPTGFLHQSSSYDTTLLPVGTESIAAALLGDTASSP